MLQWDWRKQSIQGRARAVPVMTGSYETMVNLFTMVNQVSYF